MVQAELILQSDSINYNKIIESNFPFSDISNINVIAKFLNLSIAKINLFFENQLDWEGICFIKEVENNIHLFSGGRFGFCGFFPVMNKKSISYYLDSIDSEMLKHKIISYSLTGTIFDYYNYTPIENGWTTSNITYYIAEVGQSVSENGLIYESFKNYKRRRDIKNGLKMAQKENMNVFLTSDFHHLDEWHKNCHLARIEELDGRVWDYNLFAKLIKSGTGKLIAVTNKHEKIIGGCFILFSEKMIELFMMSTPKKYLALGTNYLIIEYIYKYAFKRDIKNINWQASNPPDGEGAHYKRKWNAIPNTFYIFNKINGPRMEMNYIKKNFKDCYVFPFSVLKD